MRVLLHFLNRGVKKKSLARAREPGAPASAGKGEGGGESSQSALALLYSPSTRALRVPWEGTGRGFPSQTTV